MAEETYADWTVEELKAEASEREIEGRSAMNKEELIAALEADDASDGSKETEAEEAGFSTAEVDEVDTAAGTLEKALEKVNTAIEKDDRSDPERYQGLKDDRERLKKSLIGLRAFTEDLRP